MKRSYDLLKFGLMWGNVGMQELGWVFGFSSNIAFGVVDMHKSTCSKSVFHAAGHDFIIYDGNTHTQDVDEEAVQGEKARFFLKTV
jgi:hypothetical protein